jgi:uncharacterized protein
MILKFLEIEDGVLLKGEIDGSQYKSADDNGFTFVSPVSYELSVKKFEDGIQLSGPVACQLSLTCGRCLEDFQYAVRTDLDIEISRKSSFPEMDELELNSGDLDVYYFDNNEIDLNPLVYEEVLLNIPIKPLCNEDCRGLCDMYGKNRNDEVCAFDKSPETPLGEKLKSFLAFQGDNHGSSKTKNISIKKG